MPTDLTTLPDDEFVEFAYQKFLGRFPDPGGKAGYLAALRSGLTRLDLIVTLVSSPEYHAVLIRHLAAQSEAECWREQEGERIRSEILAGRARAAAGIVAFRRRPPSASAASGSRAKVTREEGRSRLVLLRAQAFVTNLHSSHPAADSCKTATSSDGAGTNFSRVPGADDDFSSFFVVFTLLVTLFA